MYICIIIADASLFLAVVLASSHTETKIKIIFELVVIGSYKSDYDHDGPEIKQGDMVDK
jgi:hypothetical protein